MRVLELLGNAQRLDGGAMFGNVPRALWSQWLAPDETSRVELACRCLLVEDQGKYVLLETGIGAFFPPEKRERYGVVQAQHVLLESLARHGLTPQDIDVIVLSHLHFDHAGGLLAAYDPLAITRLMFTKARFMVSGAAFARACNPHPRDRASFIPELPLLLEQSGRLEIHDPQSARAALGPGWNFVLTDGHTPGMLHTWLHGKAERLLFCADLIPGTPWVHLPVTMGYDRYPEALIDEKAKLLSQCRQDGTWLYFTHDPSVAAATVTQDEQGRYRPLVQRPRVDEWWDLDVASR